MATVITVLKIIGFILLGIFAFAAIISFILLFVPVRYKINADYDSEITADVRVSFLLHIVSFRIRYKDELGMKLRIFGIPVPLNKKKSAKEKTEKAKADETLKSADDKENQEDKPDNNKEKQDESKKDSNKTQKIKEILDILNDESTRRLWETCKYRFKKLFAHVLPSKCRIVVTYGLNNPYYTSLIMSIYEALYTYLGTVITLIPVYDDKSISGSARIKGHLRSAPVLWQLIRLLLNRDCIRFIRKIRGKNRQAT